MEEVKVTQDGAILSAEFFKNSELIIASHTKTRAGCRAYTIYEALDKRHYLRKTPFFGDVSKLIGEVNSILVDQKFNTSLVFSPVSWPEGRKQYGFLESIELVPENKPRWFEFLMNPEARTNGRGTCLYLPKRYFLDKQRQ